MFIEDIIERLKASPLNQDFAFGEVNWRCIEKYLPPDALTEIGSSKMVFYEPNKDYVLKIPFNSASGVDDDIVCPFSCANEPNHWNYCEEERLIYQKAFEKGIEHCFVPIEKIADINGYPIYRQPKVEPYRVREDHLIQILLYVEDYCLERGFDDFDSDWVVDFIDYYGLNYFKKLLDFLEENKIIDLHGGNLGLLNDVPVIVDYGSFRE